MRKFETMAEGNRRLLSDALRGVEINDEEERSLAWLCGCDRGTVTNLVTVIKKARQQDPQVPEDSPAVQALYQAWLDEGCKPAGEAERRLGEVSGQLDSMVGPSISSLLAEYEELSRQTGFEAGYRAAFAPGALSFKYSADFEVEGAYGCMKVVVPGAEDGELYAEFTGRMFSGADTAPDGGNYEDLESYARDTPNWWDSVKRDFAGEAYWYCRNEIIIQAMEIGIREAEILFPGDQRYSSYRP